MLVLTVHQVMSTAKWISRYLALVLARAYEHNVTPRLSTSIAFAGLCDY